MHFRKPTLKNLSQGARLEYVKRLKRMDEDDIAEYFGFGGDDQHKTFRYHEINFDCDSFEETDYNEFVQKVINEWKQMRDKRENLEESDEEYLEWKFHLETLNEVK